MPTESPSWFSASLALRRSLCVSALLVAVGSIAGCAVSSTRPRSGTTPAQWQEEQLDALNEVQRIYESAQHEHGLLAQDEFMRRAGRQHASAAFAVIFGQYENWLDGFLGSYLRAQRRFSIAAPLPAHAAPSPLAGSGHWRAVPALDAIARLARDRRAVFFNEDHTNPETRSLTVAMLARLRRDGFNTFAAETLHQRGMVALRQRRYVTAGTGFYTREPVYADMVNTALRLGYRVIAYEAMDTAHAGARELGEATNLYKRAFVGHPDARLVVNAGFSHVEKQGRYLGGASMAEVFMHLSGIDPLVIEQTMLVGRLRRSYDNPYWRQVISTLHPRQPIIFINARGRPWSILPQAYDASVFFPRERISHGRPTWLGLWGLRVPVPIPGGLCRGTFPCLVAARPIGMPRSAVPADRVLLDCRGERRALWLRPGAYALTAVDEDDRLIDQMRSIARAGTPLPHGSRASAYRRPMCHPLVKIYRIRH